MPISAAIAVNVNVKSTSQVGMGNLVSDIARGGSRDIVDGVGAGAATKVFSSLRTLAASATENLDLAGALTDPSNVAVVFTGIKAIYVKAAEANVNDVIIGGHATAAFVGPFGAAANTIAVAPGETFFISKFNAAGWPVTATTADMIKVLNSGAGTAVNYEVVIVGI